MNVFEKVSKIFQDVEKSVEVANLLDRAYAEGVGHPEYHAVDFTASDVQSVAMSLAGLYAADTAANILVDWKYGIHITEERYVEQLKRMVDGSLSPRETYLVKNAANLAWRAGQPFRGLDRITRNVNSQFNTLPPDEEEKDLIQVRAAARWLLSQLED